MADLSTYTNPIRSTPGLVSVEIPPWINQDLSPAAVERLSNDAWMNVAHQAVLPMMTENEALATMNDHGKAVCAFLVEARGEDLADIVYDSGESPNSWSGLALFILWQATLEWAASVDDTLREMIDDAS